ncbi:MAG: amidohydrolase family protein [Clostridiales bacterium]|jgi:predicted TIM-barrel fold metal-dependent hydrolase|nr:amidohydrolase family protein [Clostridiales bacterium]
MKYINKNSALAQEFWEKGYVEDCPIYDFHGHMHEMFGGYLPAGEPEQMLHTMKRAHIESFIFSSHLALYSAEIGERANQEPVKKYGRPLRAYLGVKSYDIDFERDRKALEENPDVYAGCKFLTDYYGVRLEDPRHTPYWEYLNEHKLLALCHTWGGSAFDGPENVRKVAHAYPDVTIICGHSMHGLWDEAIDVAREYPNVYLELTAVMDDRGVLEKFVRALGSERIVFGTDLPWFSTFHYIGCILDADITDDDRRNIFYRNGQKLMARFQ